MFGVADNPDDTIFGNGAGSPRGLTHRRESFVRIIMGYMARID